MIETGVATFVIWVLLSPIFFCIIALWFLICAVLGVAVKGIAKMKIEVGKRYLLRNGTTVRIALKHWWDESGCHLAGVSGFDIIAECRDTPCLKTLRKSTGVRRWHTHQNLRQSLGEHIAGMHMIIEAYHPSPSVDLLRAINLHDAHEVEFGDIPFDAKTKEIKEVEKKVQRAFFEKVGISYPSLSEEEQTWLKFADQLDACLFLEGECMMFNLTDDQEKIMIRCSEEVEKYAEKLKEFGYNLHLEDLFG